jgi:hypothetical protein
MPETNAHLSSQRFKRRRDQLDEAGLVGSATGDDVTVGLFRLGAAEAVTIASGVATVTKSHVRLTSESSTSDQLDSIVLGGGRTVADGDILLLRPVAGHTITVDDANINLGAATRAVAPGGSLLLVYDGGEAQWTEVAFLAGADNV